MLQSTQALHHTNPSHLAACNRRSNPCQQHRSRYSQALSTKACLTHRSRSARNTHAHLALLVVRHHSQPLVHRLHRTAQTGLPLLRCKCQLLPVLLRGRRSRSSHLIHLFSQLPPHRHKCSEVATHRQLRHNSHSNRSSRHRRTATARCLRRTTATLLPLRRISRHQVDKATLHSRQSLRSNCLTSSSSSSSHHSSLGSTHHSRPMAMVRHTSRQV